MEAEFLLILCCFAFVMRPPAASHVLSKLKAGLSEDLKGANLMSFIVCCQECDGKKHVI